MDDNVVIADLFTNAAATCQTVQANGFCANSFIKYVCTATCDGWYTADDRREDQTALLEGQYGVSCAAGAAQGACSQPAVALVCPVSCAEASEANEADEADEGGEADEDGEAGEANEDGKADEVGEADEVGDADVVENPQEAAFEALVQACTTSLCSTYVSTCLTDTEGCYSWMMEREMDGGTPLEKNDASNFLYTCVTSSDFKTCVSVSNDGQDAGQNASPEDELCNSSEAGWCGLTCSTCAEACVTDGVVDITSNECTSALATDGTACLSTCLPCTKYLSCTAAAATEIVVILETATTMAQPRGATTLKVADVSNIYVGDTMVIGAGDNQESGTVVAVTLEQSRSRREAVAGTVTLEEGLMNSHPAGTVVIFQREVAVVAAVATTTTTVPYTAVISQTEVHTSGRSQTKHGQDIMVVGVVFGVLILAMAVFTCKNGGGGGGGKGDSDESLKFVFASTDYNVVQSEIQNANLSPSRPPGCITMSEV